MIVVLLAVVILGSGVLSPGTAPKDVERSYGITGASTSLGGNVGSVNTVQSSLDEAVRLTGANDSNVTIDGDADLGHDLSACSWGTLDSDVVTNNENALLLATQEAITWYNGTSDTWEGYYYNTSSRDSFRASVSAPSPTTWTLVCLNHANQSLNLSANTTTGSSVATGSSNIADYPENVSNYNGSVEETRLFDEPLNGSRRTEWVAEPGLATTGPAPAARVTYDNFGSGTSYTTFFASGTATATNATVVTGFGAPTVAGGTDYSISGGTLSILGGGVLEADGEVLYVGFRTGGSGGGAGLGVRLGQIALALAALLTVALAIDRRL
jgi:hypothetical protein